MSAFYIIRYAGTSGQGNGVLYIGKGLVVGVDVAGAKYRGSYSERSGHLHGTVKLTAPTAGSHLVTGQSVPGGQSFDLKFDLPTNFASGRPQTITGVGGQPVQVTFEKVSELR
jgi:hypothetical protein